MDIKALVDETIGITHEEKSVLVKIVDGVAKLPNACDGKAICYQTDDGAIYEPSRKQLQQTIEGPSISNAQLYARSCSNDSITIESWREQWMNQTITNSKKYNFVEHSVMSEYPKQEYKPVIIAGSGPSLRKNGHQLAEREDICVVSCLHNFGYFEDLGIMGPNDYYLTLDAGKITVPEVSEGGKKYTADEYWSITKDRTLIAHHTTYPELMDKWKGKILFFTTPQSDPVTMAEYSKYVDITKVPVFNIGGNALGACFYMARAILGCGPMILVGADFAFDRMHKFHSWDSGYDSQFAGVQPVVDIFGDRLYTWPSYFSFKCWFDHIAVGGKGANPHLMINATEGGILGAYPEGNIKQILQMSLRTALSIFTHHKRLPEVVRNCDKVPMLLY